MSATNGEALVSAINRLLVRLDAQGVSANEIVACIKPLIADSEAAAVQDAMLREYGNLCATNESLAKERDQLRAEVERLKHGTVAQFKDAFIDELTREVSLLIARAERAEASLHALRLVCGTTDADKFATWVDRANARLDRAEAEIKDRAAMMRDVMRERDAAEAELAEWHMLRLWGTTPELVHEFIKGQQARIHAAQDIEAELAAERARLDDLVADLNDACITLASATDDCDDYALLNTRFKLTAVRDVLIQYIPNAAMKEGK